MKEKHDCFVKKVRDRKGSKMGYEGASFSRDEVKIPGQGALSPLKKITFLVYGGSPFWGRKLRVLTGITHPSTGICTQSDLSDL